MNNGSCSLLRDASKHHERGWFSKFHHTREGSSTFLKPFRCLLPNTKDLLISENVVLKGVMPMLQAPVQLLLLLSLSEGWVTPQSHMLNIISCELPSKCSEQEPIPFLLQVLHYLFVRSMEMITHVACQNYPPNPRCSATQIKDDLPTSCILPTIAPCW